MDRRILKTRKLLQEALLSLLREMPFEKIEIQAITDRANTARVTFYRHYGTKEELLVDMLADIYEELRSKLTTISADGLMDFNQTPPIQVLFDFLQQDRALYKNLLTGSVGTLIQRRVRYYLVLQVVLTFSASPHYADQPIALIANSIASQTIGNMMWWLEEELPYSPAYMARLTHLAAFSGAMTVMERHVELKGLSADGSV
jgi:AcrR family transcriptional regulator